MIDWTLVGGTRTFLAAKRPLATDAPDRRGGWSALCGDMEQTVQMDRVYTGTDNLEVMAQAVRYNAFLVKVVTDHLPTEGHVLDFGAGIGTFARILRERGYAVDGLETDAAQRMAIEQSGLTAIRDLSEVSDGYYAGIYTLNVLEHIEDDVAVLKAMHRVLRPGGRLVVYVPAWQVLYSAMDSKVGHVRRYGKREIVAKVRGSGFQIEAAHFADSLGVLGTLTFKAIGSKDGVLRPSAVRWYDRFAFPASRALDRAGAQHVGGKNLVVLAKKAPSA